MSTCSYCMFMYLHHASWHFSATLTEVFPCFFLSCKANARIKPTKTEHGPHSSKMFVLFYVLFFFCSVYYLCVILYSLVSIFINKYMVVFLYNNVIYVFLLLCLCILIVCLYMATLTEVFPCFFLSCKANARVNPAQTGHGPYFS